jgi:magnesium transporter
MPINTIDIRNGKDRKWIDVIKPTDDELETIAKEYHISRPIVIDCLDPDHLPKHEQLKNFTFIILRLFNGNVKAHLDSIQDITTKVAIFFNDDFLITVHRLEQPFFETIKKETYGDEAFTNADIVARIVRFSLASFERPAVVLGEQIENYEATVLLKHTKSALLQGLYYLKRKSSSCKKILLLTDDLVHFLKTTEADHSLVQDIQDLYTKLLLLYDQILDDLTNLLNIYLSLTAQKTNQVMKILTVFSVFFMPLTFIVGIYGMNFKYMPELYYRWSYPIVWLIMIAITVVIFFWFKKKKWL